MILHLSHLMAKLDGGIKYPYKGRNVEKQYLIAKKKNYQRWKKKKFNE